MRATIIGLAGALIAIVIGIALMPEVFNQIDTLNNVVGDGGQCEVVTNRYKYDVEGTAGDYESAFFTIQPYGTPYATTDAPVGLAWALNETVDSRYTGLPTDTTCTSGKSTLATPITQESISGSATTLMLDVLATYSPDNQSREIAIENTKNTSYPTDFVGVAYKTSEERRYSGVMLAFVGLMPLLIIVGIVGFIVFRFGMGSLDGVKFGRRRRRRGF